LSETAKALAKRICLHENELPIDETVVARLLREQFPDLPLHPIRRIESSGTVHAIFAIGDDLSVRMPRVRYYEEDVLSDWRWLRYFASRLPLQIPQPVALGEPTEDYPCHWLIVRWIPGENATRFSLRSMGNAAAKLGEFVSTLRSIDVGGVKIDRYRGRPLRLRDELTREAISAVGDEYDTRVLSAAWNDSMQGPDWSGPPCFFHGDLHSGNLISTHGALAAVIDFGGIGTGDPSVDGIAGWWLFDPESRGVFRDAGAFTKEMWARARGWALSIALVALPYYRESNPAFAGMARYAIDEVLSDEKR
jgi:aminoglycoside phosphotransferase (APT) family kinase protein